MTVKLHIKKALLRLGYEVRCIRPEQIGYDPFRDMHA
jgi:hypothetical protein